MPIGGKTSLVLASVLSLLTSASASAQPPDLTYHTVAPCVVLDTRVAGGAFAPNETRTYNVVGSGSLASQGGSSTGCNIPGFSNNIPQVQAVALNIVAITPSGVGNIKAHAADIATTTSVLNFTSGTNVANTAPVAVAQISGAGDFKITVGISSAHVLVSVVGYYSKAVQTVYVHPVPGDHTASGTRLINALAGITDASATKRYVVKIEPGIYDVGATGVQMKPYVDIEGSGQEATVIRGTGGSLEGTTAVVVGAASSEIRDLQVKAEGTDHSTIGILLPNGANTIVKDVTINASETATLPNTIWGLRILSGALSKVEDVTINTIARSYGYGIGSKFPGTALFIKRTVITVTGSGPRNHGISAVTGAELREIRDTQIDVNGSNESNGIYAEPFAANLYARITNSSIRAGDYGIYASGVNVFVEHSQVRATASQGIGIEASNVVIDNSIIEGNQSTVFAFSATIGASRLHGGPGGTTCAGVYDESFTFYASTCP